MNPMKLGAIVLNLQASQNTRRRVSVLGNLSIFSSLLKIQFHVVWLKLSFQGRVISSTFNCRTLSTSSPLLVNRGAEACLETWIFSWVFSLVCELRGILLLDILTVTGNTVIPLACLEKCCMLFFVTLFTTFVV